MEIKKNFDETQEIFLRKKWFVNEIKPRNKKQFNESVQLANIWINIIFLGCIYPPSTMNKIKLILHNSKYNKSKNF